MKFYATVVLTLAVLIGSMAGTLDAHEKGVIILNTSAIAPGGAVVVTGSKLGRNASVRLELRGALATINFGRFNADTAGRLNQQLTIPPDLQPGQYTIAAVAADGDVSAQVDLIVTQSATAEAAHPGMHDMPGMSGMGGPHATAERMDIPISTTATGRAVIWSVILLSALGGFLLLRGSRPHDV